MICGFHKCKKQAKKVIRWFSDCQFDQAHLENILKIHGDVTEKPQVAVLHQNEGMANESSRYIIESIVCDTSISWCLYLHAKI